LEEFGLKGYGMYWILCELVAEQGSNYVITSQKKWKQGLIWSSNVDPSLLDKMLISFADANLISKKWLNRGALAIPKMKDYSDNWTKRPQSNSVVTTQKLPVDKIRIDKIRIDKKRIDTLNLSKDEKQILECFLNLSYKIEESEIPKWAAWLNELKKDNPEKNLLSNAKKWRDYFETKPPKNHKSSFRNWIEKDYADKKTTDIGSKDFYEKKTQEHLKRMKQ